MTDREIRPYLEEFYGGYDEDARLLSPHGQVEYWTTMRYIERYLRPGDAVLEIGAATGRYSHALARRGHPVEAVELLEENIRIFREKTLPGETVTVRQGDARDLSCFPDGRFDMTLLLGPLYHLFTREDRRQALREALRVTRPGGVMMSSWCGNDATVVSFCFQRGKLAEERYRQLVDPVTFRCADRPEEVFSLVRPEDVDALMEGLPAERLHFIGTDMATRYMSETVDAMDEEMFELWMKYHFSICERRDMVGVSHHYLDVNRKI